MKQDEQDEWLNALMEQDKQMNAWMEQDEWMNAWMTIYQSLQWDEQQTRRFR